MALAFARVVASSPVSRLRGLNRSEHRPARNASSAGRGAGPVARATSRRRAGRFGEVEAAAPLQGPGSDRGGGGGAETNSVGAFPKIRPLARGSPFAPRRNDGNAISTCGRRIAPAAAATQRQHGGRHHVVVVYATFGNPETTGFSEFGSLGKLATDEEAEADAESRFNSLTALVTRKRLYFAVLQACELVEGEVPDGKGARKLAVVDDLEELEELVNRYEERCTVVRECELQAARLETMLTGMGESPDAGDWATLFDDPADAKSAVTKKVKTCRDDLTRHAAAVLKSLPYRSLEDTQAALTEARERLDDEDSSSVVAKTVERVGSRVQSTKGLLKTGVSKLREKPLEAASSAAEYTKGVWVRLNGGMDGYRAEEPNLVGLPQARSKADERQARVLRLTLEVQDRDKALSEASKARDGVMAQGRDSLSRVRLAQEIRASDDKVSLLRRVFAVRTLQLEMERIVMQLEEEAAEAPSLDAPGRSDEVELLAAEFGAMDRSLSKLVSAVDRGAAEFISDEDLTVLATDIPDLKSRLGIADDGLTSLSPEVIGERVGQSMRESVDKAKEGGEFMGRGVKMLFSDIGASARFFGRAAMGSTLRPREVQTIRRTTLDIFTFMPFVIILIIPLTPVGHVLIFSFIQKYFPALFPSQFSGRRQAVMKKYEELKNQLDAAEKSKEMREDDEAFERAVTAVESLKWGGATEAEINKVMTSAGAAGGGGSTSAGGGSFFRLKGLERRRPESSPSSNDGSGDDEKGAGGEDTMNLDEKIDDLRKRTMSAQTTLSFGEDNPDDSMDEWGKGGQAPGGGSH